MWRRVRYRRLPAPGPATVPLARRTVPPLGPRDHRVVAEQYQPGRRRAGSEECLAGAPIQLTPLAGARRVPYLAEVVQLRWIGRTSGHGWRLPTDPGPKTSAGHWSRTRRRRCRVHRPLDPAQVATPPCRPQSLRMTGRSRWPAPRWEKSWLAEHTNSQCATGQLAEVLDGADVFIGVSAPNLLSGDELIAMAEDPIVFALANPDPEVEPAAARKHAAVVATGRSDQPNQINNLLVFPGVARGLLDAGVD